MKVKGGGQFLFSPSLSMLVEMSSFPVNLVWQSSGWKCATDVCSSGSVGYSRKKKKNGMYIHPDMYHSLRLEQISWPWWGRSVHSHQCMIHSIQLADKRKKRWHEESVEIYFYSDSWMHSISSEFNIETVMGENVLLLHVN